MEPPAPGAPPAREIARARGLLAVGRAEPDFTWANIPSEEKKKTPKVAQRALSNQHRGVPYQEIGAGWKHGIHGSLAKEPWVEPCV